MEDDMINGGRCSPRFTWTAYVLPLVLLVALGALGVIRFWRIDAGAGAVPNAEPRAIVPRGRLADDEKATIDIFREASPGVVHITTLNVRQDVRSLDLFQIPRGTGSGFVWDKD